MNGEDNRIATDSAAVALWTTVSRLTGFARGAVIAAVLGPTYFANTFQATNLLPNLTYELLTGSLFASLLMPHLVRHLDVGDETSARRVAGGFLGITMVGFVVLTVGAVVTAPLLLRLFSVGVATPEIGGAQRRVGVVLMAMLMPQVVLYAVAGTSGAVLNARGRFGLAAAAPAFENLGMIVTLGVSAVVFGTAPDLETVRLPHLLLLGLGTTAAVGLHAGALWWGTWRVGVGVRPLAGWRDGEVRELVRRMVPSLGYAGLNVVRLFAVLVVANRVPGGVVAFQLALNFFYLPVALGARPVAVALLPRLARLHRDGASAPFRQELRRGMSMILFLTTPAAVAYATLATPLAAAVAFGEMSTAAGRELVAVSLLALSLGVVGEGTFIMATYASYAQDDAAAPFRSSLLRTGVVLVGMAVAFTQRGPAVLVALGVALSVSNLLAAAHLGARLSRALPRDDRGLAPAVLRAVAAALLMAVPSTLVARFLSRVVPGRPGDVAGVLLASAVGALAYLGVQGASRSPEMRWLAGTYGRLRPGGRS
ncbi:MAG: hypothetical protein M3326_00485 [Actinomycetota bacterium]|nr:hypothetical protein [Actinomycetota bacterium]